MKSGNTRMAGALQSLVRAKDNREVPVGTLARIRRETGLRELR
jgi:hypothetical protein